MKNTFKILSLLIGLSSELIEEQFTRFSNKHGGFPYDEAEVDDIDS